MEEIAREAIQIIVASMMPAFVTEGTVTSIDKTKKVCNVERDGLPELHDVRLNAILSGGKDLVTVFPSKGSKVICLVIENDPTDAMIIAATDIESITAEIQGNTFDYSKNGILINGGNLGGLIKIQEMTKQLSAMTKRIDDIISALKNAKPAAGAADGGAALLSSIILGLAKIINKEDFSNIEDDKIKH